MMVRNYTSVCYLCPQCLEIGKNRLLVFEYSGMKSFVIRCEFCGGTVARVDKNSNTSYDVSIVCPFCKDKHNYDLTVHEFWQSDFLELACPDFENKLLIIGSDEFLSDGELYDESDFSD